MLRTNARWRAASASLKQRSPAAWQGLVSVWGRASQRLEPVQLLGERWWSSRVGRSHHDAFEQVETFVMFPGYPRSGHTVVASLLNAHPEIVIGHRMRALRYVDEGFDRDQIYALALLADRRFARLGRVGSKRYDYSVPGQWQGRFQHLRVLGDGDIATGPLSRRPDLFERLRQVTGVPVKMIHVVRNPFDNIATLSMRNRMTLPEAVERYFSAADKASVLRAASPDADWLDLRHEDLLADAAATLSRLCAFLGAPAPDDYLQAGAGIVYGKPNQSRGQVSWPEGLVDQVTARMATYEFLRGYSFAEPAPTR